MRFVHIGCSKVAVVGGDQWDTGAVRERNKSRFQGALAVEVMAMQLHRDAVRKGVAELGEQTLRLLLLTFGQKTRQRSGGTAGQQDQPFGMRREGGEG